jgi:SAM-dependent methyltransferase
MLSVMDEFLKAETEKLERSWIRHDATMLRDYLVAGVEDPRINVQSILTRHFLASFLPGDWPFLRRQEYSFAAAMNWVIQLLERSSERDELDVVLYALKQGADNAEGIEIPRHVLRTFATLPARHADVQVPNYLSAALEGAVVQAGKMVCPPRVLNTFQQLWASVLSVLPQPDRKLSVFEPACGSANDYRFLVEYGLATFLHYHGQDLCPANVENARALCPGVEFAVGNVFEVAAKDAAYDACFAHDLLEHLSLSGIEAAISEIARVTRLAICLGFFNMDEIPEHKVVPFEDYHWNVLSMQQMRRAFGRVGFHSQVVHIGSFLREEVDCEQTHNPNAYTFLLDRMDLSPNTGRLAEAR